MADQALGTGCAAMICRQAGSRRRIPFKSTGEPDTSCKASTAQSQP
jgi:hypothetical protein